MNPESDHDIIVGMSVKLDRAILDIKEIKDNVSTRVDLLEREKVDRREFDELKESVLPIRKWVWMAVGGLAVLEIVIGWYTNTKR